jgi:hypothetical protein
MHGLPLPPGLMVVAVVVVIFFIVVGPLGGEEA